MYNLFHYYQSKQYERQNLLKAKEKNDFLRRHQKFKELAILNRWQRLDEFVDEMKAASPFVIPDEYFEHSSSALHKIATVSGHNATSKFFANTRENSSKSCTNNLKACVNKLHVNDDFKVTKEDMKYLTDSLSFQQENHKKISESSVNFKVKADKLMNQYQHSLSKFDNARYVGRNRYRLCQITHFNQQQFSRQPTNENPQVQKTPFSLVKMKLKVKKFESSNKEGQEERAILSEIGQKKVRSKTYFKLAKTTQMLTKDSTKKMKLNTLLSRSHYDRIKDVSRTTNFIQWPSVSEIQSVSNSVILH